jgi:hypothetical protein
MFKALDRGMVMSEIQVCENTVGREGIGLPVDFSTAIEALRPKIFSTLDEKKPG